MSKLRVGFIGAGAITDLHYLGYKDNPKAELHAICDVDEALLRRRASDWQIGKTYTDYRQLLADPDVDAVEVITPHHLHAEMGIAALEAGKNVSVQKPMAITVAECDALIEAAQRAGKLMRVFENFRFYPPLMKAKELLDAGAIGEPLSIRIKCVQGTSGEGWEIPYRRWVWRFDPAQGGGGRVHPRLRLPPFFHRQVVLGRGGKGVRLDHAPPYSAWLDARQPGGRHLEIPERREVRLLRSRYLR